MGLRKYYPYLIRNELLVDMRKLIATIFKGIISVYQTTMKGFQHDMKFLTVEQLSNIIDPKLIPVEMGGPRFSKIEVPDNIQPLKYLCHYNISDRNKEVFYDCHNNILNKAKNKDKNF